MPTLLELCRFFDVSLDIFECATYDACYDALARHRIPPDSLAWEIERRIMAVSHENRELLLRVISWLEAAEREENRRTREK